MGFTPKAWALPCSMCVCWSGHSGSLAAPRAVTLAGPAFPWAAGGGGRLFLGPVPSLPTLDSHTAGRRWAPGNTRQAPHLVPVDLSPCLSAWVCVFTLNTTLLPCKVRMFLQTSQDFCWYLWPCWVLVAPHASPPTRRAGHPSRGLRATHCMGFPVPEHGSRHTGSIVVLMDVVYIPRRVNLPRPAAEAVSPMWVGGF